MLSQRQRAEEVELERVIPQIEAMSRSVSKPISSKASSIANQPVYEVCIEITTSLKSFPFISPCPAFQNTLGSMQLTSTSMATTILFRQTHSSNLTSKLHTLVHVTGETIRLPGACSTGSPTRAATA